MTIYFKDGSSKQVYKISFKGQIAELYLLDGSVQQVAVEKLDLPSSGIGAPVGTYGQTKVGGARPKLPGKTVRAADPERQNRLRAEWERAEEIAIAVNDIGPIRKGDTVKIVGQTQAGSQKRSYGYYEDQEYYDDDGYAYTYRSYKRQPLTLDEAYVILYKSANGTFGKRLFDAAGFSANFEFPSKTPAKLSPKELPVEPVKPLGEPDEFPPPPAEVNPPEAQPPSTTITAVPPKTVDPAKYEEPKRDWVPLAAGAVFVAALGVGLFVVRGRNRAFIDTSKFGHYEEDLREFEIAIWLKNGKTVDQILEICLKKFYQDNPAALNLANKVWKGGQRGLLLPLITKQSGKNGADAEKIFVEFQGRIERIRQLIQDVSIRTGVTPMKIAEVAEKPKVTATPVTGATRKIAEIPIQSSDNEIRGGAGSSSASAANLGSAPDLRGKNTGAGAGPVRDSGVAPIAAGAPPQYSGTSSVVAAAVPPRPYLPPARPVENGSPKQQHDLPAYAATVLNQIAFLSGTDEKLT